jgi:RNA polymerase sigma-70 factor (ECF subfamily)
VPVRPGADLEAVFVAERPRLVGLAYRVLGTRTDAEDVVQEAWLRLGRVADPSRIERPEAWLTRVVSRLALDELRTARRRRERYVGPWLPEPVRAEADPPTPEAHAELAESLTVGFLRVLERLEPVERVVLLLADVFRVPYDDIAATVGRSPDACRQVASRARRRVADERRRVAPSGRDPAEVAAELLAAVSAGEVGRVVELLADDVELVSDGGAEVHAARRPVTGADRVARFLVNVGSRLGSLRAEVVELNGSPGLVLWRPDGPEVAASIEVDGGRVVAVHVVRNPHKLAALRFTGPVA